MNDSFKGFFYHYSMGFGLIAGYNYDENYDDFVNKHISRYYGKCLNIKGIDLTEHDIYLLSKLDDSEAKKPFVELAKKLRAEGKDDNYPLLISSHSGSSDYLTIKKILDC